MHAFDDSIKALFAKSAVLALAAGPIATARAQTGAYTLNGGTVNSNSISVTTSVSNQSGIFVYNSGSLNVGTVAVTTSGDSTNTDNSDKYGINAGVLAGTSSTKGAIVITNGTVATTGSVANGLFATDTGSSVTMLGGSIVCSGSNAHGVDATYGGAVTLSNVNVTSFGDNSSAVATDYGGGTVLVTGGTITASNTANMGHSAAVYSTGTITVKNATATSKGDNGGVIDGANAIILTNTALSGVLNGIKIHNTSGASGNAAIVVNGGTLAAAGGDVFYLAGSEASAVSAVITVLSNATLAASSGNLLNLDGGSTATFTVIADTLSGNVAARNSTNMATVLLQNSTLTGCVNAAKILSVDYSSTWNATSNSVVSTTLTNAGTINLTGMLTCTNVIIKTNAVFGGTGALSSNLNVNAGATLILNPATNFIVGGNLVFGGAVTVKPSVTNIAAGTYKLLTYSNSLSGTPVFSYTNGSQIAVFNTATSGVITVTISMPVTIPAAPAGLTATNGDAQVSLKWNAVTNATSYFVKRSPVSGGSDTNVSGSATTNFTAASLVNGTRYYFVVTATNSAGESAVSSEVNARPTSSVATNLTLSSESGTLTISWPADHTGWKLQTQTNTSGAGLGTNWVDLGNDTQTNQTTILVTSTNGSVFFRLAHP
jgi:hypothetical protein